MHFTCPRCEQETDLDKSEYDGYGWVLACGCGRVSYEFEQTCDEAFEPAEVTE